ncbi:DUF2711 family protein [Afifella aestuarii]|uniref:DUF2711 family protein n=1 Tax=Afifella aestuarii TaxID=1909496 RepID=UPI000FE2C062|nr:DUF2711 family protein [Afifella aestuarii]
MDAVDRYRFGPPDDTPILPWFGGAYTHGFVALHPFFTVDGLDPTICEYGTLILSRAALPNGLGLLEWGDDEEAKRRVGKDVDPEEVDRAAKRNGLQIGWQTICRQAGFADHCELDQALRTSIDGLRDDLADAAKSDRLASYCSLHRIFPPNEGRFEPLMQASLASLFRRTGHDRVIVGDEFGEDERLVDAGLLEQGDLWDAMAELPQYGVKRLIAPDRSLLAWVHWDSFYTLILGKAETFQELEIAGLFEGFWCSDETETYWLTQPCIPLAE